MAGITPKRGDKTQHPTLTCHPPPYTPKHKNISNEMIQKAFCHWLAMVADDRHPLVVFQGLFVTFPVLSENLIEGQLIFTHNSDQREENVAFLYESVLNTTSLMVISGSREILHTTIRPMLAYTGVSSFDPYKPTVELSSLGGVSILAEKAISHLEICFASKPLNEKMFLTTPGLINGMLLITGVKGSGKTSLAHAVLRQVADKPNYAHTVVVECKPLRGKKVDTIQKMLEILFNEAAWRQPAVILLDDLDHIMGSPSGPESEMSAEALYAARIAEVIKDLLRKEIRNLSQIAVIATSQSRSSLHPIIVSSRGSHFVQDVVEITPPNKLQRVQILEAMVKGRGTLMTKMDSINCMKIANKTEGYVARDFFNLLNRAVHAHILTMGRSSAIDGKMEITEDDFERAFHGFTPASLRNVPLHQAGELGWDDIGGLKDIKKTLVQTLQWPSKYPMLFANCPLRLQSGLLLYGAPGTGKTLLAGAVAKECGLNFISIKGPELLSKYIGASEQAIRDLFNRAQSAKPCILFFDEFDSIAPRRGHDNTGVTDRVVNQLLTQLDGVEGLDGVYVLGATSRPDLIDPALLRPGRLDKCLCCPMPDEDDRLQILEALVRKLNMARNVDLEYFAKKCTDFTGADIKALLYNSQLEAIHEVTDGNERLKIGSPCKLPKENTLYARTKDVMGDSKLRAKIMTKEIKSSASQSQFIYFPNLEKGAKDLTPEMEERFNIQVSQIQICDRKMSVHIAQDENIESPLSANKMFTVQQSHLEKALSKMRPSVSKEERLKYRRIYENFLLSRGGNFGTGMHDFTMKATLA